MVDEYKEQIKQMALDEQTFVRLTIKGKAHNSAFPWRQVIVRPVLIKNEHHLQFSYFTDKQDITKNYRGAEGGEKLDEMLALPFSTLHAQSTEEDVVVQITKKGKPIIHRSTPARLSSIQLAHDHSKKLPLPADRSDSFLQAIGIMDQQGKVLPSMQGKFSQINEFLKLLAHTGELEHFGKTSLNILDC